MALTMTTKSAEAVTSKGLQISVGSPSLAR